MADVIARTERLILRRDRPGDLDTWMRVMNTPAVTRHLGGPAERQQVEARFARNLEAMEQHGFGFWKLELRESGEFAGHCGLTHIQTEAAPDELRGAVQAGWSLAENLWGRGLAREAAQCVLSLGFGRFGMPRIFAQTSEFNELSWRLMERLGMQRMPELEYVDPDYPPEENPTIVYKLERDHWLAP